MKQNNLSFLLLLVFLLFVSISCDNGSSSSSVGGGTEETLKIGILIPQSGTGPLQKEPENACIEIAAADVNEYLAGSESNKRIEGVIRDTQFDSFAIETALQEFKESGIKIVVCACTSSSLAYVKSYVDDNDMLLINNCSTSPSLAEADNVYRLISDDDYLAVALSDIYTRRGIEKVVILYRGDVWGETLAQAIEANFNTSQGAVVQSIAYDPRAGSSEYEAMLSEAGNAVTQALASATADKIAVQLISYDEGTDILEKASENATLGQIKWFGSDGFVQNQDLLQNPTSAAFAAQVGMCSPIFAENNSEDYQAIKSEIAGDIGYEPYSWALLLYDCYWLASKTRAHNEYIDDIAAIKGIFELQAASYEALTGSINLNNAGDRAVSPYDFWAVEDDNGTYLWVKSFTYNDGILTDLYL
jgi:ABC-type branched-subunit amino acid transport system substrate-binding protein